MTILSSTQKFYSLLKEILHKVTLQICLLVYLTMLSQLYEFYSECCMCQCFWMTWKKEVIAYVRYYPWTEENQKTLVMIASLQAKNRSQDFLITKQEC